MESDEEDSNYQRNLRDQNEKYVSLKRKKKGNAPKEKTRKRRKILPELPRAMSGRAATRERDEDGEEAAAVSCYASTSDGNPAEGRDGFFGGTIEVPLNELNTQLGNSFVHSSMERWLNLCYPGNPSENRADIERDFHAFVYRRMKRRGVSTVLEAPDRSNPEPGSPGFRLIPSSSSASRPSGARGAPASSPAAERGPDAEILSEKCGLSVNRREALDKARGMMEEENVKMSFLKETLEKVHGLDWVRWTSNCHDRLERRLEQCSMKYCDDFLRPPAPGSGERSCVNGKGCICNTMNYVFPSRDNLSKSSRGFVCREFLLPSESDEFAATEGLPRFRAKCLLCIRLITTYLYHDNRKRGVYQGALIQNHRVIVDVEGEYDSAKCLSPCGLYRDDDVGAVQFPVVAFHPMDYCFVKNPDRLDQRKLGFRGGLGSRGEGIVLGRYALHPLLDACSGETRDTVGTVDPDDPRVGLSIRLPELLLRRMISPTEGRKGVYFLRDVPWPLPPEDIFCRFRATVTALRDSGPRLSSVTARIADGCKKMVPFFFRPDMRRILSAALEEPRRHLTFWAVACRVCCAAVVMDICEKAPRLRSKKNEKNKKNNKKKKNVSGSAEDKNDDNRDGRGVGVRNYHWEVDPEILRDDRSRDKIRAEFAAQLFSDQHLDLLRHVAAYGRASDDALEESWNNEELGTESALDAHHPDAFWKVPYCGHLPDMSNLVGAGLLGFSVADPPNNQAGSLLNVLVRKEQYYKCRIRSIDDVIEDDCRRYPAVLNLLMMILEVSLLGAYPHSRFRPDLDTRMWIRTSFQRWKDVSGDLCPEDAILWIHQNKELVSYALREFYVYNTEASGVLDRLYFSVMEWQEIKDSIRGAMEVVRSMFDVAYDDDEPSGGVRSTPVVGPGPDPEPARTEAWSAGNSSARERAKDVLQQIEYFLSYHSRKNSGLISRLTKTDAVGSVHKALESEAKSREFPPPDAALPSSVLEDAKAAAFHVSRTAPTPEVLVLWLKHLGTSPTGLKLAYDAFSGFEDRVVTPNVLSAFAKNLADAEADADPGDFRLVRHFFSELYRRKMLYAHTVSEDLARNQRRALRWRAGLLPWEPDLLEMGWMYYCEKCMTWLSPAVKRCPSRDRTEEGGEGKKKVKRKRPGKTQSIYEHGVKDVVYDPFSDRLYCRKNSGRDAGERVLEKIMAREDPCSEVLEEGDDGDEETRKNPGIPCGGVCAVYMIGRVQYMGKGPPWMLCCDCGILARVENFRFDSDGFTCGFHGKYPPEENKKKGTTTERTKRGGTKDATEGRACWYCGSLCGSAEMLLRAVDEKNMELVSLYLCKKTFKDVCKHLDKPLYGMERIDGIPSVSHLETMKSKIFFYKNMGNSRGKFKRG